ncbi:hypothetical protein PNH38_03255 [Anoxybacillus rupiensis]|uniref:Uncharacterized protein n=2 Tax=Bacillales TaxID=1385 RepID=A0ABT5W0Q2_9BACL|nr:hypothetical protein [Anoxybacillus rupiensis]
MGGGLQAHTHCRGERTESLMTFLILREVPMIKKAWLFIMAFVIFIVACSHPKDAENQLPDKIPVTIKIVDQDGQYSKFLVHVVSEGYQNKDIAHIPQVQLMIVNSKSLKLHLYSGVTYTFEVSPTHYRTIDEYLKNKKEGVKDSKKERLPTGKTTFTPHAKNAALTIDLK